jgi:hypothetical protein
MDSFGARDGGVKAGVLDDSGNDIVFFLGFWGGAFCAGLDWFFVVREFCFARTWLRGRRSTGRVPVLVTGNYCGKGRLLKGPRRRLVARVQHYDIDAAIFSTAVLGIVGGYRMGFGIACRREAAGFDTVAPNEDLDEFRSAGGGELPVGLKTSGMDGDVISVTSERDKPRKFEKRSLKDKPVDFEAYAGAESPGLMKRNLGGSAAHLSGGA